MLIKEGPNDLKMRRGHGEEKPLETFSFFFPAYSRAFDLRLFSEVIGAMGEMDLLGTGWREQKVGEQKWRHLCRSKSFVERSTED